MEVSSLAFYIISAIVIVFALLVVTTANLVRAALALAFCFFSIAGIFWILGSPFVAVLQLVVNAGAIPIVTIFIVMMTQSDLSKTTLLAALWAIPVAVLLALVALKFFLSPNTIQAKTTPLGIQQLGVELLSVRNKEIELNAESSFLVQGGSIVVFEVTAILLLVAFVGAIILARSHNKKYKEDDTDANT